MLSAFPVTTLLLGEYATEDVTQYPEFAVADAIISLETARTGHREKRVLQVMKLRGSGFLSGHHAYRIEELLSETMEDGLPRLRIFSSCRNLLKELPSARIKEGTDDIEKENDHALDAMRYAIMSRMPHPERPDEEEEMDARERYARRRLERLQNPDVHMVEDVLLPT